MFYVAEEFYSDNRMGQNSKYGFECCLFIEQKFVNF